MRRLDRSIYIYQIELIFREAPWFFVLKLLMNGLDIPYGTHSGPRFAIGTLSVWVPSVPIAEFCTNVLY